MKKKVAIIGAGYTGLQLAKRLSGNYEVDLIEMKESIGGMTETFDAYGTKLEYFYRHIFKCDTLVTDLVKELGLEDNMDWGVTKMGYYVKDKGSYLFGTPISLLKFKPLNLWDKFMFGMGYIQVKLIRNWKKLENVTADEWMKKHSSKKSYECIFEPLLISKFGSAYKDISMVWLWNKLVARSSSGENDGESLGYLKGSYGLLTEKFSELLKDKGVNFKLCTRVNKISKDKNGRYVLKLSDKSTKKYDKVISTIAFPYFADIVDEFVDKKYLKKIKNVKYTATKTLIMFMNKSFMPYYWLNIGDTNCPFGGLIEHTNMQDKKQYNNKYIMYVSNYLYEDNPLYKMNAKDLFKAYLPYLKQINPEFDEKWIERLEVFQERYAQPIVKTNYSKNIPELKVPKEELYVASMPQIYPEDRGMNKAIELANKVADLIMEEKND